MPPSFTDAQLDALMRVAAPLHPRDRRAFMEDVARALDGREIGDGSLHRVAIEIQRRYWSPPLAASTAINGRR
jgi:hypothetical protein